MAIAFDEKDYVVVEHLRGHSTQRSAFGIMLGLGLMVMFGVILLASNTLTLIACGTIWTGWNVLWGFSALMDRQTNFAVYRKNITPGVG